LNCSTPDLKVGPTGARILNRGGCTGATDRAYNRPMLAKPSIPAIVLALSATASAGSQRPLPFPKPGQPQKPAPEAPAPAAPAGEQRVAPPRGAGVPEQTPTEETLGLPIYPGATFITSYDAGRG